MNPPDPWDDDMAFDDREDAEDDDDGFGFDNTENQDRDRF